MHLKKKDFLYSNRLYYYPIHLRTWKKVFIKRKLKWWWVICDMDIPKSSNQADNLPEDIKNIEKGQTWQIPHFSHTFLLPAHQHHQHFNYDNETNGDYWQQSHSQLNQQKEEKERTLNPQWKLTGRYFQLSPILPTFTKSAKGSLVSYHFSLSLCHEKCDPF